MTSNQVIEKLDLERIFDEHRMVFDLVGGTAWNPAKTRIIILSTDLLTGVYNALLDEAGPAWKLIFYNCGSIWGQRVARRLDSECTLLLGRRVGEMPLSQYLEFMARYFVFHGWGRLSLDVSHAKETGVLEVSLEQSVFSTIVHDTEEMADPMIAGILGSMLSYVSGHRLACTQTDCITRGSQSSRFLITAESRLSDVDTKIRNGASHEELLAVV